MASVDLIIFDNDGVLVDSELIANRVLSDLLTEAGHPTSLSESIQEYMGGTLGSVRVRIRERTGNELPGDFEDQYHARLFRAFEQDLTPVPGIHDVLAHLSTPYCVASSGSVERIVRALAKTGLLRLFEGRIFSADDVPRGKPAPDVFLHAASHMGVDPSAALVVEDSPNGVAAGKAAGMRVLGYAALTPAASLRAADRTFTDMRELPALLQSLAR